MKYADYVGSKSLTGPAVELFSTADLKTFSRVENTDEDALLAELIIAARIATEKKLSMSFISQTRQVTFEAINIPTNSTVNIPFGPLISVQTIKYYNSDDVLTTISSDDYKTDLLSGRVKFETLPSLEDTPNALEINYTAGFGTAASDVPGDIILAVKFLAGFWIDNRELAKPISMTLVPATYDALLFNYSQLLK